MASFLTTDRAALAKQPASSTLNLKACQKKKIFHKLKQLGLTGRAQPLMSIDIPPGEDIRSHILGPGKPADLVMVKVHLYDEIKKYYIGDKPIIVVYNGIERDGRFSLRVVQKTGVLQGITRDEVWIFEPLRGEAVSSGTVYLLLRADPTKLYPEYFYDQQGNSLVSAPTPRTEAKAIKEEEQDFSRLLLGSRKPVADDRQLLLHFVEQQQLHEQAMQQLQQQQLLQNLQYRTQPNYSFQQQPILTAQSQHLQTLPQHQQPPQQSPPSSSLPPQQGQAPAGQGEGQYHLPPLHLPPLKESMAPILPRFATSERRLPSIKDLVSPEF